MYNDTEENYYHMLFGRGKGDADVYGYPGESPTVMHIIEPEDGFLIDMVQELDLTGDFKLKEGDSY